MIFKIILTSLIFFLYGCGGSQEPSSTLSGLNFIKNISIQNIQYDTNEDENISFSNQPFLNAFNSQLPFEGIKIISLPTNGYLDLNNTHINLNDKIDKDNISYLKYIPNKDFNGKDSFEFQAFSGNILSNKATLYIDINAVNDTPVFTIRTYKKSFEKNSITGNFKNPVKVLSIDLDKDGKRDILTTDKNSSKIVWLKQEDNGTFKEENLSLSINNPNDIKVVDIDKDNDYDIIAAGDNLILFLNNNMTFSKNIIDANTSFSVDIGDLDNDGDLDIASADYQNNSINIFKNNNLTFTKENIDDSILNPTDIKIYDYNQDGKKDLIVSAFNNGLVWYEQKINSFEKNIIYTYQDQQGTNALTVSGNKILSVNYDSQTVMENNTTLFKQEQPTDISIADMDNDGDYDIVTSSFSYAYIIWYENINNLYKAHVMENYCYASSLVISDIDNDSDQDIITSIYDKSEIVILNSKDSIYTYENNKTVSTISATDVDGDKLSYSLSGEDSNLFTIDDNGTISFINAPDFENPKDTDKNNMYNITVNVTDNNATIHKDLRVVVQNLTYFTKKIISTSYTDITDIAVDNRGIFIADDYAYEIYLLEKDNNFSKKTISTSYDYPMALDIINGKMFSTFFNGEIASYDENYTETLLDNDCQNGFKIIDSDLNGDNLSDAIITCDDKIKWFKQESNLTFTKQEINITFNNYINDITTNDKNHQDIYVAIPDENTIYILKNNSDETFQKEILDNNIYTVNTLNSDNNNTFATSANDNQLILYTPDNNKTIIDTLVEISSPNSLEIADINNDSKKDLILTSKNDGKLIWYKNLGNNNYEAHLVSTLKDPVRTKIFDINSDGFKDIIVATKTSVIIFYGSSLENKPQTTR